MGWVGLEGGQQVAILGVESGALAVAMALQSTLPLVYSILPSFASSSDGLAAFRAFLRTEFSEENLEFWLACEEYKKIKSQSKMASKAKKIFAEYIAIQSCKEVSGRARGNGRERVLNLEWLFSHLGFFSSSGEPGLVHPGPHQGEPAECDALLLRPGAAADIRADGEGLIPPLPALRTLLGLGQPKKAQLHLHLHVVLRDGQEGRRERRGSEIERVGGEQELNQGRRGRIWGGGGWSEM